MGEVVDFCLYSALGLAILFVPAFLINLWLAPYRLIHGQVVMFTADYPQATAELKMQQALTIEAHYRLSDDVRALSIQVGALQDAEGVSRSQLERLNGALLETVEVLDGVLHPSLAAEKLRQVQAISLPTVPRREEFVVAEGAKLAPIERSHIEASVSRLHITTVRAAMSLDAVLGGEATADRAEAIRAAMEADDRLLVMEADDPNWISPEVKRTWHAVNASADAVKSAISEAAGRFEAEARKYRSDLAPKLQILLDRLGG